MNILKKDVSKQFLRFCLIGLECAILTYLVFLILYYYLSINYLISSGAGFISGVLFGFMFNKIYTFESKEKSTTVFPPYLLVYFFTFILAIVGLKVLVENFGLNPLISTALLMPVTTFINFFGTKILAFKNKKW